jgi:hypothetical protein
MRANTTLFIAAAAMLGCKDPPLSIEREPPAEAASSSTVGGATARPPEVEPDGGAEAPEASRFSIECRTKARAGVVLSASDPAWLRGCVIRGRVLGVRSIESDEHPKERVLDFLVERDNAIPCRTPIDASDADANPLRTVKVVVRGGSRIAGALREGASVCGWAWLPPSVGLGYGGWVGAISTGTGALLGAGSAYLDAAWRSKLGLSWRLVRVGRAARHPIDGGGVFVGYRDVRIFHGGVSAVSTDGSEVILRAKDGTFAVSATSDLNEGPVPIYEGHHDGFAFSAVRLSGDH